MTTVLVAGGGTGGHLFPGLAVAEVLRHAGIEVVWLGASRGLEATRVPAAGFRLVTVNVSGAIGLSPRARLAAVARLPVATLRAVRLLLGIGARAVLAVGGYASLPGTAAAAILGLPLVLQEQNAIPGIVTRLAAPFSDAVACGFHSAVSAFPSLPARWTGNPIREGFFGLRPVAESSRMILVLGGSQGSAFLNRTVPEAMALLPSPPLILHQSGGRWADEVQARYAALGVPAEVVPFLEDPTAAVAGATIVIARAGALTVTELAAAQRASILVPFAAAAHGHQLANARALAATGAAEVIEERRATPAALAALATDLLDHPQRGTLGAGLARPQAASDVARLVVSRAGGGL